MGGNEGENRNIEGGKEVPSPGDREAEDRGVTTTWGKCICNGSAESARENREDKTNGSRLKNEVQKQ